MEQFVSWTFKLRWVLWGIGALLIVAALVLKFRDPHKKYTRKIEIFVEENYRLLISFILGVFFVLSVWEKFRQFESFGLNAEDFWLFVDILEQTKRGAPFLTRFAPQNLGFVQHGSVHPMLTWGILTPLAWVLGSVRTSLLFNPLCLTGAGALVGKIAKKQGGTLFSLLFTVAFLASTQVGKILHYDVHPEAIYPFLVLLWLGCFPKAQSLKMKLLLLLTTLLCVGVKEDSLLVLGPWLTWYGWSKNRGPRLGSAWLSAVIVFSAIVTFQMLLVSKLKSGAWGLTTWESSPVIYNAQVGLFQGHHWAGFSDVASIASGVLGSQGGLLGVIAKFCKFWFSRGWISLLIFAPWVLLEGQFWIVILPLSFAYSLLEGPNHFWNYYSAPFLGSFWFCAIESRHKTPYAIWACVCALLLGSSSIEIDYPTVQVEKIKQQTAQLVPCLSGRGFVPSHLLGLVPTDSVWTDRIPRNEEQWSHVSFALFSPQVERYEVSRADAQKLFKGLSQDRDWQALGKGCKPVDPQTLKDDPLVLFVKSGEHLSVQ